MKDLYVSSAEKVLYTMRKNDEMMMWLMTDEKTEEQIKKALEHFEAKYRKPVLVILNPKHKNKKLADMFDVKIEYKQFVSDLLLYVK